MIAYIIERRGRRIFNNELIKILNRKKKLLEIEEEVVEKVKRHYKLSSDEFWKVHELLQKEGPKVRYTNPDRW